jgi:predicted nucleic acid-binding protein
VKTTADTSVLVACFASWHAKHPPAVAAIERVDTGIAHCLLETYSVLTRLPPPHRISSEIAAIYVDKILARRPVLALPAAEVRRLIATCAGRGLGGGAVYDALIATTCLEGSIKLLTLDARARKTYESLGVDHELVG